MNLWFYTSKNHNQPHSKHWTNDFTIHFVFNYHN